ncbi:GNAT family N-acetyltransferase [Streptomyces poonensis]|nr:GNAT family N-acetyltransferase [Streptomyces poonensis]
MTRWQADLHREDLANLYLTANSCQRGTAYDDYQHFLGRLTEHMRLVGFDLVVAESRETVGMAYGAPLDRPGTFWRHFVGDLPGTIDNLTAQGQAFAVLELMVLPAYRRLGIAGRLLTTLLNRSGLKLATALVPPDNRIAHAAYRAWGWAGIGRLRLPDGPPAYDVLAIRMP